MGSDFLFGNRRADTRSQGIKAQRMTLFVIYIIFSHQKTIVVVEGWRIRGKMGGKGQKKRKALRAFSLLKKRPSFPFKGEATFLKLT
jgi:hypothetical protein